MKQINNNTISCISRHEHLSVQPINTMECIHNSFKRSLFFDITAFFLLAFILLFGINKASAQVAVYVNHTFMTYYYCYNNGEGDSITSWDISECARKECEVQTGEKCDLYIDEVIPGWYGLVKYYKADGGIAIGATGPDDSESEAEESLKEYVNENEGTDIISSNTFHVYNRNKK